MSTKRFLSQKSLFPRHSLVEPINGEKKCNDYEARTRALSVSEVHPGPSDNLMSSSLTHTLPLPLDKIFSITVAKHDEIDPR